MKLDSECLGARYEAQKQEKSPQEHPRPELRVDSAESLNHRSESVYLSDRSKSFTLNKRKKFERRSGRTLLAALPLTY